MLVIKSCRLHLAIPLVPLLHLWRVRLVVLTNDAALVKVVGDGEDNIMKFQMLLKPLWNGIIAHDGADDMASDGSCGVTIPIVIDGSRQHILETVDMAGHGIYGNGL